MSDWLMSCQIRAFQLALNSEDSNTEVGAVAVRKGEIVGEGFNYCISELSNKRGFVHAEARAIVGAKRPDTLVATWACCVECAKLIVISGIQTVWTCKYDYEKWEKEIELGHQVLAENDIEIKFYEPRCSLKIGGIYR